MEDRKIKEEIKKWSEDDVERLDRATVNNEKIDKPENKHFFMFYITFLFI